MPNQASIQYRQIDLDSDDYGQSLRLRDEVLRRPWGQSIAQDDLSREGEDLIWGAFAGDRLVGMAILQATDSPYDRLRYMAVDPAFQGQGIGSTIARHFEARSRQAGRAGIRLMARTTAIPFYEKLGYQLEGKSFVPDHIDIPHIMMVHTF